MGLRAARSGVVAAAVAAAGLAACSGEEPGEPGSGAPQREVEPGTAPGAPARGLDRSNEQEVAELVADHADKRPSRCRESRRLAPGQSRFACRAGGARYLVDWQHYGTGRYTILRRTAAGALRAVASGTLTISE